MADRVVWSTIMPNVPVPSFLLASAGVRGPEAGRKIDATLVSDATVTGKPLHGRLDCQSLCNRRAMIKTVINQCLK